MPDSSHILITGGAGFIGSHLTDRLIADGNKVTILDDFSTGQSSNLDHLKNHPDLTMIEAQVSTFDNLPQLIESADFVVHLAAAVGVELVVKSPVRTIETNIHETEVLLDAASASKTPVLLASTSEVYGKSSREAFSEEDDLLIGPPHLGRWSYACSKLLDEFLGLAYHKEKGLPVIITRFFNTVGPRQTGKYGMVVPRFVEAALENKDLRIHGDGNQTRCFCHVLDTVEALTRLIQTPEAIGEVFNIGSTHEISIKELAEEVIAQTESDSSLEFIPYDQAYEAGFQDMLKRKPVVDKLERVTGFRPSRTLKQIIEDTAAAIR